MPNFDESIQVVDDVGNVRIVLQGDPSARAVVGGTGRSGEVQVDDAEGQERISLQAVGNGARIRVRDDDFKSVAELTALLNSVLLALGGEGFDGSITLKDSGGTRTMFLDSRDREFLFFDTAGRQTVRITSSPGDISLHGADTAELITIADSVPLPRPGSVLIAEGPDRFVECRAEYDTRVVGVVSGAGEHHPGVVLGSGGAGASSSRVAPLALNGRVTCLLDATEAPIGIGDLLTTSATGGHAKAATDQARRPGTIVGKALTALDKGIGHGSVLIALQ